MGFWHYIQSATSSKYVYVFCTCERNTVFDLSGKALICVFVPLFHSHLCSTWFLFSFALFILNLQQSLHGKRLVSPMTIPARWKKESCSVWGLTNRIWWWAMMGKGLSCLIQIGTRGGKGFKAMMNNPPQFCHVSQHHPHYVLFENSPQGALYI